MFTNTSSSLNSSLQPSCFVSSPASSIFTAFTVTNLLLLLPLSVFILCYGFQRWRKQRSGEAANPVDVFTYHMVAMEMLGVGGSVACCCGGLAGHRGALWVGCNAFAINSCIKMLFHALTCVERYAAVVHPMSYLTTSQAGGVTIRNASIGCVWLLDAGLVALRLLLNQNFTVILFFCNLVVCLILTSFCSLSVLRVLNRPAPGEEGGKKGRGDALKQRAFVTISAIMAVLLLRFGGNLVCLSLARSELLSSSLSCVVQISGIWFCLPSSYVLPLLFLHRAHRLPGCSYPAGSG